MKGWMTASEIAAAGLPGLPATERAIQLRAQRESWPARSRKGRGGGREYDVSRLPREAREAIVAKVAGTAPALVAPVQAPPAKATAGLADWQRRCMDARAAILLEIERLAAIGGQAAAIREIIRLAGEGSLRADLQTLVPFANAKAGKAGSRTLSRATIFRWKAEAAKGVTALAPRESVPGAGGADVPLWAPALLKLYRTGAKRPLAAVLRDVPAHLPEGVPTPTINQARRFLDRMSTVDRERGRHGPNGLLKFKAFRRRSTDGLLPMDIASADGHCFKADVAHPVHGRPFRPEVVAMIDIATRYAFGWSAGLSESTHVTMDAIRSGVEALGQFALFYTDNGAGFTSETIADEVTGLLARIGSTPVNSIPGRAQSRGKVERLQGSLWKDAARLLPTYSGRDMDNEARRRVVKLVEADIRRVGLSPILPSWTEFLAFAGEQVAAYNNRPHRSLGKIRDRETGKLRHMSPAEALDAARASGWEPMMLPPEVTEDLFRPQLLRKAIRGEVSLPWGRYFSKALEAFGGDMVRVAYDVHDGSRVWIRTVQDGRLICIAERDANVVPEMPASKIEHARKQRESRRLGLLQEKIALVRAEAGPQLLELSADQPFGFAAIHETLQAEFARIHAEPVDALPIIPTVEEMLIPRDAEDRFAFWHVVDEAIRTGTPVSERQRRWHLTYQDLPEFTGRKALEEPTATIGTVIPTAAAS